MVYWLLEKLFWGLWPVLPQRLRERLSHWIVQVRSRSDTAIPVSDVEVYVFTDALEVEAKRWEDPHTTVRRIELPAHLPRYSLVTTCRNEVDQIEEFLESIRLLEYQPRELVLCDGGSDDGTVAAVEAWSRKYGDTLCAIRIIADKPRSIAAGRNAAAAAATEEILLFADVGTILQPRWAGALLAPFVSNRQLDCAMGWYESESYALSDAARAVQSLYVSTLEEVVPSRFLPSGRSIALRKSTFLSLGGYPEEVTKAGEDTLFDLRLKRAGTRCAFVPEAVVTWRSPRELWSSLRTVRYYAAGDGQAGLFWGHYLGMLRFAVRALLDIFIGVVLLSTSWLLTVLLCVSALVISYRALLPFVSKMKRSVAGGHSYWLLAMLFASAQIVGFLRGAQGGLKK